jgi:adenylate cyclase
MIMMQICKNKNNWKFEEIKQHHNQMLKVLFNGF